MYCTHPRAELDIWTGSGSVKQRRQKILVWWMQAVVTKCTPANGSHHQTQGAKPEPNTMAKLWQSLGFPGAPGCPWMRAMTPVTSSGHCCDLPRASSTFPPVAVAIGTRKKRKIPTCALCGSHSNPSTQIMTLNQECCCLLPDEPHHGEWSEKTGENTRQRIEINRTQGLSCSLENNFLLCQAEDCCKTPL